MASCWMEMGNTIKMSRAPRSIQPTLASRKKSWEVEAAGVTWTTLPTECGLASKNVGLAPYHTHLKTWRKIHWFESYVMFVHHPFARPVRKNSSTLMINGFSYLHSKDFTLTLVSHPSFGIFMSPPPPPPTTTSPMNLSVCYCIWSC